MLNGGPISDTCLILALELKTEHFYHDFLLYCDVFVPVLFLWLHGSSFQNLEYILSCEENIFCSLNAGLIFTFFTGAQFDIGSQVVGQKDMSKNVLDIWKEVICTTLLNLSIPGYNFLRLLYSKHLLH
jgi:hypothetical protein